VKKNELLTSAAKWFRPQCDAEDEESDAFGDLVLCGMGWTETRLDYEDNPEGDPKVDRTDPLEMVWDSGAKKRNLVDGRRLAHNAGCGGWHLRRRKSPSCERSNWPSERIDSDLWSVFCRPLDWGTSFATRHRDDGADRFRYCRDLDRIRCILFLARQTLYGQVWLGSVDGPCNSGPVYRHSSP
jgi:hypothetical protein